MSVAVRTTSLVPFLLSAGIGAGGAWLAITFGGQMTPALAAVPLAGAAAGLAARGARPALLGTLAGVVVPVSVVSIQYLLNKIAQCPRDDCGISGPGITAVIVGVIIVAAAVCALAGLGAGRAIRRLFPSLPGL